MALQGFLHRDLPVVSAAWLNEVDVLKYSIFADATTKALARTAVTSDAPLEVINGGTGTRYGGIPYNLGSLLTADVDTAPVRAANTLALQEFFDPDTPGPTGNFVFPNLTGTTAYNFGVGAILLRRGCHLDLQQCSVNFGGSFDAAMDLLGFFTILSDTSIGNGFLTVTYPGTAGSSNGMAIRMGMRGAYPFGSLSGEEEELSYIPGKCRIWNLRIQFDNPDTHIIGILGTQLNSIVEGNIIDGNGDADIGISYEFGHSHYAGGAAGNDNITAHAVNLQIINNFVKNCAGEACMVTGAMTPLVENLYAENCASVFVGRPGEANYLNMTDTITEGMKAHYILRGLYGKDITSTGIALTGAQSASGYLATDLALLDADDARAVLTNQISFSLDGFDLPDSEIAISGRHVSLANGRTKGGGAGGQLLLQDDLTEFDISNVQILDSAGIGVRCQSGTAASVMGVSAATSASPIEITTPISHGLTTGREVQFHSMPGDFATPLNSINFPITVTAVNKFTVAVNGGAFGAYTSGGTFGLPIYKSGSIRNSKIAGNASVGLSLINTKNVFLGQNIIGYTLERDGVAEATQDAGVSVSTVAYGVVCDGNDVATFGGAVAYALAGNGDRGCEFRNPRGLTTFSGAWSINGVGRASQPSLVDVTASVNTTNKYTGKMVYDTSNTRLVFAQGAAAADTWITAADSGAGDTVATLTPI